jgi:hypothetical protein
VTATLKNGDAHSLCIQGLVHPWLPDALCLFFKQLVAPARRISLRDLPHNRRQCGGRGAGCVIASTLRWRLNALGAARLIPERRVPHPAAAPTNYAAPCGGAMFPIPSGRKLTFVEIAKYWSREVTPPASPQELRDVISKAWWRGELVAANGSSRLSVLRGYYLRSADFIAFVIPGAEITFT